MSIEGGLVSLQSRIINKVGSNELNVIFDPLSSCTSNEITSLMKEIEVGLSDHFDGPGFTSDSLYTGIFGLKHRGKILALSRDLKSGNLNTLVSGQILNNNSDPVLFNGSRVCHLSLIYSSGGNSIPMWNFLTREILAKGKNQADYFSCFTQDPKVYSLLRHVSGAEIYPNHNLALRSKSCEKVHQQLIDFFGGTDIKKGVFREKVSGSFTSEREHSKNSLVDNWFYDNLGMMPEKGDLLLLVAKIEIPGR